VSRRGDAAARVAEAEAVCRELLARHLFGTDDETLEGVVVRELAARRLTVATAESCTGGFIANRLTNVPGASVVLRGGVVAYHNGIKESVLQVPADLIAEHGAVSEPVARAMAEGARKVLGADYALSVTGIAGPGGGTPEKPVGTVFIGLASAGPTVVLQQGNPFDRETFKYVTSQQALNLLRRALLGL
jgi:nicotinamide-nucleotide amidase